MAEGRRWHGALTGVRRGALKVSRILSGVYLLVWQLAQVFEAADYHQLPVIRSRVLVGCLAQAHLIFAAFVLDAGFGLEQGEGEEALGDATPAAAGTGASPATAGAWQQEPA